MPIGFGLLVRGFGPRDLTTSLQYLHLKYLDFQTAVAVPLAVWDDLYHIAYILRQGLAGWIQPMERFGSGLWRCTVAHSCAVLPIPLHNPPCCPLMPALSFAAEFACPHRGWGSTVPKLLVAPGRLLVWGGAFARENDDDNTKNYNFWAPFLSGPQAATMPVSGPVMGIGGAGKHTWVVGWRYRAHGTD